LPGQDENLRPDQMTRPMAIRKKTDETLASIPHTFQIHIHIFPRFTHKPATMNHQIALMEEYHESA